MWSNILGLTWDIIIPSHFTSIFFTYMYIPTLQVANLFRAKANFVKETGLFNPHFKILHLKTYSGTANQCKLQQGKI